MDKRLKQWEKLEREGKPVSLPKKQQGLSEEEEKALRMQKAREAEERAKAKKEKKAIHEIAKKSLDVGHWTKEVLGGGSKFNTVNTVVENKLASAVTGLMTKEQFTERREALEAEERAAAEERKRKQAEQDAVDANRGRDEAGACAGANASSSGGGGGGCGGAAGGAGGGGAPAAKKKKSNHNKATLSFDVDEEDNA